MFAVMGGTGFYDWPLLKEAREESVKTPYGEAKYLLGNHNGKEFIFMPRHGKNHDTPPHKINYRANIYALKQSGVKSILAVNSVGGLVTRLGPGEIVLVNDILDFTYGRENTFYDGGDEGVYHVDMSKPYCCELREQVLACAHLADVKITDGGIYAATQGPRFETPAEVKMLASYGATVVGMTGMPEVALAREAGIDYAALCVVANLGSGLTDDVLTMEDIQKQMKEALGRVQRILDIAAARL